MRIVGDITADLLRAIKRTSAEQERAFRQVSSGRRIEHASDDPAAFVSAAHTAARLAETDQFVTSTATLKAMMQTDDSALSSVVNSLTRAIGLGVQGANGSWSSSQRQAIGDEVLGIRDTVLSLANTAFNNTYLFAGTKSTAPPFVLDGSGEVQYVGGAEVNRVRIGESLEIPVARTGAELFADSSADVFGSLNKLYQAFVDNDGAALAEATTELRTAFNHLSTERVFYGNSLQMLEQNATFLSSNKVELAKQWDGLVAVDPTEAVSRMLDAQQAHDRTLAAASKVSGLSLLDFLK